MSQYSPSKRPEWNSNGALANHTSTTVYPSPKGWVAAIGGQPSFTITAMTWSDGVVTCTSTGHKLVTDHSANLVVYGVTPTGYNGFVSGITVIDANTFSFPLASNPGTVTVQGKIARTEVVVSIDNLSNKILAAADATAVPTFTAAFTYSGLAHAVTGDVLTVTLTASEAVTVKGSPYINITIGSNVRKAYYTSGASTSTSLVFNYTVVAGDVAATPNVTTAAGLSYSTFDGIQDVLSATGSTKTIPQASATLTAPDTSAVSVN